MRLLNLVGWVVFLCLFGSFVIALGSAVADGM